MTTAATILMITTQVTVTLITAYFFFKMLGGRKPKTHQ
jgi:hypothetical protein